MFSKTLSCALCSVLLLTAVAHAQSTEAKPSASPASPICRVHVFDIPRDESQGVGVVAEFLQPDVSSLRARLIQFSDAPALNPVFPHPHFFARSFENRQIGFLYDRVIRQADEQALAQLVQLAQTPDTPQRADAQSALAFVHFALASEANTQRGVALIQAAIKGVNNYPSVVFWGRSLAWGGPYSEKNLKTAMNYLGAAGSIPQSRRDQKTPMDPLNAELVHTLTLEHLIQNEPEMPFRDAYAPMLEQAQPMRKIQATYKTQFERSAAFKPVNQILGEFKALFGRADLVANWGSRSSRVWSGWEGLQAALANQEQVARQVLAAKAPSASEQTMLASMDALNERLQVALSQLERPLYFQLMSSNEDFPHSVKAVTTLATVQESLSRSCALSQTWQSP